MPDVAITQHDALTRLHIISYLEWQREGELSFEVQRARILDILARLTAYMQRHDIEKTGLRHFLAGSQTILLEDVAAVRADLLALLAIYNAGGRLSIGPWYVQPDVTLVSGEALIRNLLLGKADILRHGMKWLSAAFMPDAGHYTAQLPQIFNGFGIEALVLYQGRPVMPLPFRWQAPDNSDILVTNYRSGTDAAQTVKLQSETQPDGPFLWLNMCRADGDILPDFAQQVTVPVSQSTPTEYIAALRQEFPDTLRPRLHGELHLQESAAANGRYSARMPLKQMNAHLQTRLTYGVEPLLALALTHGNLAYPENARALLHYGWRLLLQNQAHPLIGGACLDGVYEDIQMRQRRIEDVTAALKNSAQTALFGTIGSQTDAETVHLLVWNPHHQQVNQVVETPLHLPKNQYPDALLNAAGQEIPYSLDGNRLEFPAAAPAVGYAVYTLRLSSQPSPSYRQKQRQTGQKVGSIKGEKLAIADGQLNWTHDGRTFDDLINFYSGGDAGDVFRYRTPDPDVLVRAGMTDFIQLETTAFYERLIFQHRMRVAPGLENGKRGRGIRPIDLMTTATCYDGHPGVYFATRFTNNAHDHRVRMHLRTGIQAQTLLADSAFALIKRSASGLQPIQNFGALAQPNRHTLALFTRGLPEIEPLAEENQTTLALTLVRSVGILNATTAIPGAQQQQDMAADYMLQLLPDDEPTALLQSAHAYQAPLQVIQVLTPPQLAECRYLTIEDKRVILTAFKPPQAGSGWVVRLLNPTHKGIQTGLHTHYPLAKVQRTLLDETPDAEIEFHKQHFSVTLAPQQLVTLRLEFETA
jgi:mannosylglycerate hydrolase